ncbi:hypothetical protein Y032_0101g3396 [Ancylostoma ceylanicum]|uniref:Phosphatidylinositol N-acetylglucosaminyltransferase n=2 Tax=Ancylostoma ceylanicum TaxID=53326 RepID=A0A016TI31_9BILA|nr:hypothetical protein Y032_0101g3396 [Ancylostoma ceylanicum]
MTAPDAVTWQKILYKRQPFPDNYSGGDEQFLSELKKNLSAVKYTYWEAVFGVARLVFHLNLIVLLYITFEYVFANVLTADLLAVGLISTSIVLYIVYAFVMTDTNIDFLDHFYTVVVLFLFGYATTPAIRTLTDTISTDTIFALSFITALISCVFHDYGINAPIVSYQLSVSSGLSSAVFLLSRLNSNDLAFVMLSMAFALHAFSPFIRPPATPTCLNSKGVHPTTHGLIVFSAVRAEQVRVTGGPNAPIRGAWLHPLFPHDDTHPAPALYLSVFCVNADR